MLNILFIIFIFSACSVTPTDKPKTLEERVGVDTADLIKGIGWDVSSFDIYQRTKSDTYGFKYVDTFYIKGNEYKKTRIRTAGSMCVDRGKTYEEGLLEKIKDVPVKLFDFAPPITDSKGYNIVYDYKINKRTLINYRDNSTNDSTPNADSEFNNQLVKEMTDGLSMMEGQHNEDENWFAIDRSLGDPDGDGRWLFDDAIKEAGIYKKI